MEALQVTSLLLFLVHVGLWLRFANRSYQADETSDVASLLAAYHLVCAMMGGGVFTLLQNSDSWALLVPLQVATVLAGGLVTRHAGRVYESIPPRVRTVLRWLKEPWGF